MPSMRRVGRDKGNSRNGSRSKTVLTEVGEGEIDVPRDRDGSFEPQIVRKRQRRESASMALSRSTARRAGSAAMFHLPRVRSGQWTR